MRHFKITDENGSVTCIGTGEFGGVEITEAEYNSILEGIKANLPPDEEPDPDEIDDSEALAIITGGEPIEEE